MASTMNETDNVTEEKSDESEIESRTQEDEPKLIQPLDKENVSVQTRTAPGEPSPAVPVQQPRGLSNRPEYPLPHQPVRDAPESSSSCLSPRQQKTDLPPLRTPTGTSKLLRQHMKQIAITPKRPNLESGVVRLETTQTPKRFLSSGAVRVEPVTEKPPKSVKKTPRRVGFDGTVNTPSRELLKSTASSRSHQIQKPLQEQPDEKQSQQDAAPPSPEIPQSPPPANTSVDEGGGSSEESMLDGSLDSSLVRSPDHQEGAIAVDSTREEFRQGCENPVALTLLNDGKEDLDRLLERDVSSPVPLALDEFDNNGDDSTVASCPSILKVSSSLLDVMDQSDVAELARPVPFRACRSQP